MSKANIFNMLGTVRSRSLLSLAAQFGLDFSLDWLVELTGVEPSRILFALEEGIQQGLIIKKGAGLYCFKNPEKQQIWQDLLLPVEKEIIRVPIVDLLYEEVPEDTTKSEDQSYNSKIEECRRLMKNAKVYLTGFGNKEATEIYTKVIDDLLNLDGKEADLLFIDAAIEYSMASLGKYGGTKIIFILQEALARAKKWERESSEAILQMNLAKNEFIRFRFSDVLKHFEQGQSILKKIDDSKLLAFASVLRVLYVYSQGRIQEAIRVYENDVLDEEKESRNELLLLVSLIVGRCYSIVGQISHGLRMMDFIRGYCLGKGNSFMATFAGYLIGMTMLDIRRIDEAIQNLEWSVEEASKEHIDSLLIRAKVVLANAYYLRGENNRAIDLLEQFVEYTKQDGIFIRPYLNLMELCWAIERGKLPPIPGLSIVKLVDRMIKDENVYLKGAAYRHQALLQRQQGLCPETVMETLNLSLKWLEKSGSQVEMAKSQLELAHQYLLMGDEIRAEEIRQKVFTTLSSLNENLLPEDLKSFVGDQLKEQPLIRNLFKVILKLGEHDASVQDNNNDFLSQIISAANRVTGAERGAIFLLGDDTHHPNLRLLSSINFTDEEIKYFKYSSSMKMIEDVILTREGRILEKSLDDELDPFSELRGPFVCSRICVPMILRNKIVGILYHDNRLRNGIFKESDLETLTYFASQAALALENALAYGETKQLSRKLYEGKRYYAEHHPNPLIFEEIVGKSPEILHVLAKVNQVANTDATVLIIGETGAGKELVAKAIHRRSLRKDKPFINFFCSAIPENLIPSELFGHEKGAFTGANQRRIGRFELADGGTLFLDEIGDLPLEVQVRLLRVLQNKEFERVGGNETLRSDFRLVVATNRDLEHEMKTHKFRADLYYRLNVFPIYIPPLRERKEDIPHLACHFLKIFQKRSGKTFKGILESDMDKLIQYDWPGNVRELINIIERGAIVSAEGNFRLPEIDLNVSELNPLNVDLTLEENERRHILQALQKTQWKVRGKGGAAELLNIHFSTLTFRMKKLGIQRPQGFSRRGRRGSDLRSE